MIKKSCAKKVFEYGTYIVAYVLSMLFAQRGYAYASGIVLMAEALILYICCYRETGSLVNLKGLFSLSWLGGQGVSCLQLSKLQQNWEGATWLCFFLAYFCFAIGYDLFGHKSKSGKVKIEVHGGMMQARKIKICILILAICSVLCFCLEAVVVGFIPLFSPEPHAYSYFHISGVHYFTISCILIPALTVVNLRLKGKFWKRDGVLLVTCNLIAVGIPILCVSRFQLLFAVGFAAVTYLLIYQKITWKMILAALAVMIPIYVLLTIARRHDVSYLNGIFEMKSADMPIFITQPYMYIANNYENFNCMVQQLAEHTYGLRMIFPFLALTGLKFVFPQLIAAPLFVTKEELTTLTVFYDAYYDFGVVGVTLFALAMGVLAAYLMRCVREKQNPVIYLLYGQIAIYFALSFFTTWFSNPTTWFWLALTIAMYVFIGYEKKREESI